MENIVCKKCGSINDFQKVQAGKHLKAICNGCDSYIKFLPLGNPPKIHFGKFTGREIYTLIEKPEVEYLNWLLNQNFIKPKLRTDIESHLKSL